MDQQKYDNIVLEKQTKGNEQKHASYEVLKKLEKSTDQIIQEIRIKTQNDETKRLQNNLIEHTKREVLLQEMESSIPEDIKKIEDRIRELMDIEQADTLNIVKI